MESVRKTIHECEEGKLIDNNGDYEVLVMGIVNEDGIVSRELKLMATYYSIGYVRDNLGKMHNLFTKDATEIRNLATRQYEKLTGVTVG